MDFKTHILILERSIRENPAMLVLVIIVVLAVVFVGMIFLDGYLKNRRKRRRKRS